MEASINSLPHEFLRRHNARRAVFLCTEDQPDRPMVSTSLRPEDLHAADGLGALAELRRSERVYSITLTVQRLEAELIDHATSHLANRYRIISELDTLLRYEEQVYVAYAITHYNPAARPLGPLTVNIGGDCHRTGSQIRDLSSILTRTRDLAEAMLQKAVMIFPEIHALHGGKKGEWIILDRDGRKIDGISEEGIIALGSSIIPRGIEFLNRYKEREAIRKGIFPAFPDSGYIRPDSGSPDVLSGVYWRGERPDKYINMCDAWHRRDEDLRAFTCLPAKLGGTRVSSAVPTGYGVATTAAELADRRFRAEGRGLVDLRFLLEAAGGVGTSTVRALIERYGVPPAHITVFDKSEAACAAISDKFRVDTITLGHTDFYGKRLPEDTALEGRRYDVWINNGEGNNTRPEHVQNLIDSGARVFAGGANNFLEVNSHAESLDRIFEAGGWAWPDPATSGGGWTLAVKDMITRCQGLRSDTPQITERILEVITSRNARLVDAILGQLPEDAGGRQIWGGVYAEIERRVEATLGLDLSPAEMLEAADTHRWRLT